MNLLNEKLSAIRRQKAILNKKMDKETDRKKKMSIANKIRVLAYEEKELLKIIGVEP